MLLAPEPVELVIADVSGYTAYLTTAELDHAQNVLEDLLETIQEHLSPLRVVELEGDAVFAWAPHGALDGSMIVDAVRTTYLAFRRRARTIQVATACRCGACRRIDTLDLKFIVHSGTVVRQNTRSGETLTGPDAITIHRLLKNGVVERLGIRAYALFTDQATRGLGIDPGAVHSVEHTEAYEHLGEVRGWVVDLSNIWREEQERTPTEFPEKTAPWVMTVDSAAPPQLVWDYLTTPAKRLLWQDEFSRIDQSTSIRGAGTVNHCLHGKSVLVEEILDWHPFSSYALQVVAAPLGRFDSSFTLEAHDGGTRLRVVGGQLRGLGQRVTWVVMKRMFVASLRRSLQKLVRLVDATAQESGVAGSAPNDDRDVPVLVPIEGPMAREA
jgi:hypothetical protein